MSWINILYKVKTQSGPNPATALSAKLHVNYWKLPKSIDSRLERLKFWNFQDYTRNLDIGIFLQDVDGSLEEVIVCLPFQFDKKSVCDLSKQIEDETFLSFLLNHRYRVQSLTDCPTYKYASTIGEDSEIYNFCLYELCPASVDAKSLNNGTMLHIKFLSHPKNLNEIRETANPETTNADKYNLYVRFRINGLKENDLCHNEDISNDFLQSAFSKIEMAEIRFNEKRTINHDDFQTITQNHSFLNLSSINFFFTGSTEDESVIGTKNFDDCELLDEDLWNGYVGNINPMKKKCISYHWKLSEIQKIFFRTVYSSRDRKKMMKYALVVIFLSFIASALLEGVKDVGHIVFHTDTTSLNNKLQYGNADSLLPIEDSEKER